MKAARRRLAAALMTSVFLPLCIPALTGCTVAAYGLGVATMVNESKVRQREEYENYRRQAHDLPPVGAQPAKQLKNRAAGI